MSAAVTLALLFFFSVALKEVKGCSCAPGHPQQLFCMSDIVIRAKVIGKVNSTRPQLTAYKIQTIQTFKQLDKKRIQVINTRSTQTFCGINLENGRYLLSGPVQDGRVVLDLCDRVEPWNQLSRVQKVYLSRYQRGCVCEISPCTGASCLIKILQKKCLMRVNNSFILDDEEALQSICLPGSGGFCSWRRFLK
ncbi:metalloproteinase inhibitor 3-like isoform X1 [Sinocyclocheilus rhinocerous]|uniref:metalloproteinase inhibitor 3-like isoform X1 n=1 Tax=Sinocyclocheilus rhinocerous TaxID=307959 RepID=UPI0007B86AFD|nr:PREDICTED: metalloproteinase inhibitor 3-like isoform X1 [Sinocyclocheilus rhinocerous]